MDEMVAQALRRTRLRQSSAEDWRVVVSNTAFHSKLNSRFPISSSTHLVFVVGDITKWSVDHYTAAIVNSANQLMIGSHLVHSVDGAIHEAAGPELLQACYDVPQVKPGVRLPTGEARITHGDIMSDELVSASMRIVTSQCLEPPTRRGFRLPVSHVIHTAGPIYGFHRNPEALLRRAYRNSLRVAYENNIQYIAFPAISCGTYGYPLEEAATIAISTINEFVKDFKLKEVHFVLFDEDIYSVWLKKANELLKTGVTQQYPIGRSFKASMDGGRQGRGNEAARLYRF